MFDYKIYQWSWKEDWVEKGDADNTLVLTDGGMEKMLREIQDSTISDLEIEGFRITLKTYSVGSGAPRKTWRFDLLDKTVVLEKKVYDDEEDDDD